jgi:hypothetical protein
MPADQPRTRTVGCKMTDNEYGRLAAVAEGDGSTLREWVPRCCWNGRTDASRGLPPPRILIGDQTKFAHSEPVSVDLPDLPLAPRTELILICP